MYPMMKSEQIEKRVSKACCCDGTDLYCPNQIHRAVVAIWFHGRGAVSLVTGFGKEVVVGSMGVRGWGCVDEQVMIKRSTERTFYSAFCFLFYALCAPVYSCVVALITVIKELKTEVVTLSVDINYGYLDCCNSGISDW